MGGLNSRMAERGINLHTEKKVEQWKHEIMSEMSLLQSQLQLQRSVSSSSLPPPEMNHM